MWARIQMGTGQRPTIANQSATMKPKLTKRRGFWVCGCELFYGVAHTPRQAWLDWKARKDRLVKSPG